MLSEKAVFHSAFTPHGWVEPTDNLHRRTLVHVPPLVSQPSFWLHCFPEDTARATELYPDPLCPSWFEGYGTDSHLVLKTDTLHPRTTATAPFYDAILDLHAYVAPCRNVEEKFPLLLLQRRATALRNAQAALHAAHSFLAENLRNAAAALHTSKTLLLADQLYLAATKMPPSATTMQPLTETRFFTTTAAPGTLLCQNALTQRADTIFLLEDEFGAASRMILYRMLCTARQNGEPVCLGRCPLFWPDKIDHLIFPLRRVVFSTGNRFHRLRCRCSRINCRQDLLHPLSSAVIEKIKRNRRNADRFLDKARTELREVWRLQTALAELCRFDLPTDLFYNVRSQ